MRTARNVLNLSNLELFAARSQQSDLWHVHLLLSVYQSKEKCSLMHGDSLINFMLESMPIVKLSFGFIFTFGSLLAFSNISDRWLTVYKISACTFMFTVCHIQNIG